MSGAASVEQQGLEISFLQLPYWLMQDEDAAAAVDC
jgi:hypothetical protein